MKTSIETINGQKHTVVWHAKPPKEKPYDWFMMPTGEGILLKVESDGLPNCYATALPALPKNPTAKDAPLLYRYAAEGIFASGEWVDMGGNLKKFCDAMAYHGTEFNPHSPYTKITHATGTQGNRVEIAIKETTNAG